MIYKNITLISLFNSLSKIIGYIRDFLITFFFGTSVKAELFIILLELKTIFLVFYHNLSFEKNLINKYLRKKIKKKHKLYSKNIFLTFFIFILLISLITLINLEKIFFLLFPGFEDRLSPNYINLVAKNVIIFNIFNFIVVFFSSILQANKKFFFNSLLLILPNIFLLFYFIFISIFFDKKFIIEYYGHFLIFTALFQLILIFIKNARSSIKLKIIFSFKRIYTDFGDFIKTYLFSFLFLLCLTFFRLIEKYFLSFEESFISFFYLASRISNLPITVVIVAFSTVLLPEFFLKSKISNKFKINIFSDSIFYCFLFMAYICIGLYFNSYMIMDILFGRGEFLENSISQTSKFFKQKLFGVFFLSFHLILYTFFISQKENRVILHASIIGLCVSFLFMFVSSIYNNLNFFGYNLFVFYFIQVIYLLIHLRKDYFHDIKIKLFKNIKLLYSFLITILILTIVSQIIHLDKFDLLLFTVLLLSFHFYTILKFKILDEKNLVKINNFIYRLKKISKKIN